MKQCAYCGLAAEDRAVVCPLCGQRLPGSLISGLALRRLALAVLIPLLVWIVMTRLLGV